MTTLMARFLVDVDERQAKAGHLRAQPRRASGHRRVGRSLDRPRAWCARTGCRKSKRRSFWDPAQELGFAGGWRSSRSWPRRPKKTCGWVWYLPRRRGNLVQLPAGNQVELLATARREAAPTGLEVRGLVDLFAGSAR